MSKTKRVKIRLFRLFRPKSGLFRQKEDQFRSIFSKGPLSDQGLIKRTYLAALLHHCRKLQRSVPVCASSVKAPNQTLVGCQLTQGTYTSFYLCSVFRLDGVALLHKFCYASRQILCVRVYFMHPGLFHVSKQILCFQANYASR